MKDILAFSLFVSFFIFVVNFPIYIFLMYRLISYLRSEHKDFWASRGSPTIFFNNSISNSSSMVRFVFAKEFLKISDKELHKKAGMCRVSLLTGIFSFIFGFALLFAL